MNNYNEKYKDIINLPHHVSKRHPQMSLKERAAQFAPFAALTGYGDAVKEKGRLTTEKIDINEELRAILDNKLQFIKNQINKKPLIKFIYFIPDLKKSGGKYVEVIGNVKKIDEYNQVIILEDKTEIKIDEIIEIEGDSLKID